MTVNDLDRVRIAKEHLQKHFTERDTYHCYDIRLGDWVVVNMNDASKTTLKLDDFCIENKKHYIGKYSTWTS